MSLLPQFANKLKPYTQGESHTLLACAEDKEGEAAGGVAAAGVAAAGVAAGVAAGDDSAQTVASSSMHGGLVSGLLFREERLPTNTEIPYEIHLFQFELFKSHTVSSTLITDHPTLQTTALGSITKLYGKTPTDNKQSSLTAISPYA